MIWKRDLGARVSTNLTVAGNELYAAPNDYIFRLNTKTGEIISQMKLEDYTVGWPTLAGRLFAGLPKPERRSGRRGGLLLSLDPALKQVRGIRSHRATGA